MSRTVILALNLLLTTFLNHALAAQAYKNGPKEQTSFCEDGGLDDAGIKPLLLSTVVRNAVMESKFGKKARQDAKTEGRTLNPEKLLKGMPIHLANSGERFFVVMGKAPLSGGDNTWFWIVRQTGRRAKVIMTAGANCLEVRQTRTLGYRDIVMHWASANSSLTETHRYNGKIYTSRRGKWEPADQAIVPRKSRGSQSERTQLSRRAKPLGIVPRA